MGIINTRQRLRQAGIRDFLRWKRSCRRTRGMRGEIFPRICGTRSRLLSREFLILPRSCGTRLRVDWRRNCSRKGRQGRGERERGRSHIPKNVGMTSGGGSEGGDFSPQLRDTLTRGFLICNWRRNCSRKGRQGRGERGDFAPQLRDTLTRGFLICNWRRNCSRKGR